MTGTAGGAKIRPMRVDDLAAVLAMAAACPEAPRWRAGDFAAYLASDVEGPLRRTALVGSDESRILGFAAATLLLDAPGTPGGENRCELESIAVDPEARRQGWGAALVRAVVAWAAEQGARHVSLEVRASNAAAVRLYERCGLRREGRRVRYYADPEEDAILLGMPVTLDSQAADFSTDNPIEGGPPRC